MKTSSEYSLCMAPQGACGGAGVRGTRHGGTAPGRLCTAIHVQGARCWAAALARLRLPTPHWAPAATLARGCPAVPLPLLHRCWSTNNNMGFWWILRFPVFLAILVSPRPAALPPLIPSPPQLPWAGDNAGCPVPAATLLAPHGLTLLCCRSTSSSSSASSRSSSPSSVRTRCATPTTSSGGRWVQPWPHTLSVHGARAGACVRVLVHSPRPRR